MKKLFLALVLMLSLAVLASSCLAEGGGTICSYIKVVEYSSYTTLTEDICLGSTYSGQLRANLSTTDLADYVTFVQNPVSISPGETKWVPVRFTINSNTPSTGTILVTFSDPENPDAFLPIPQQINVRFVRANCTNGQTRPCSTDDGCAGTQTCQGYDWNNSQCVKDDPLCGMPGICYWSCTNWTRCINYTQTRNCTNPKNCTTPSPLTYMSCSECTSNWKCGTWSNCVGGKKTRTCTDDNGCNTSIKTETQTCSTGGSGGGGGGGGGGSTSISETQILPKLTADIPGAFAFNKYDELYITKIIVELSNTSENSQITIKKGTLPSGASVPSGTNGKIMGYILITRMNIPSDAIKDVEIQFRVKKELIDKNNATINDIRMVRYLETSKEWQKLNTSLLKQDETYAYYSADSPGFSTFGIMTEPGTVKPEELPATNTTVEQPNVNQTESGVVANATQPEANETSEPPKATGFSIADIPKSPVFMGILIFLVVVVIFVAVVRISGRNSIRIR